MLGKILIAAILLTALIQRVYAAQAPQLAGSWNVTAVTTDEHTCKNVKPGDTQAYIWIVSSRADGTISVSVQGDTSFPKLEGHWADDFRTLVLEGNPTAALFSGGATSWFKLSADNTRTLHGIRRYLAGNQSPSGRACFADFEITAKRQ